MSILVKFQKMSYHNPNLKNLQKFKKENINVRIGDVVQTIKLTEMTKRIVNIIQGGLNLEVNKVSGQKGGLAVENNGMRWVVFMEFIEDILKMLK